MIGFLQSWAESTWAMLVDSAFLLLLGLILAGLLRSLLNEKTVRRLALGKPRSQVIKLALVGIPLPLCSCSVIPVAYQLRESGVSKGGTAAFLISTPESGIDSILLTYSLMDPIMTIARPLAAFLTAFAAGFVETLFPGNTSPVTREHPETCTDCNCATNSSASSPNTYKGVVTKIGEGVSYAFTDLVSDLSVYLLVGYLLAGLVTVVLGTDVSTLPDYLISGWGGYLGALVIGVPLYICATSSTPLAAALLAVGFSPGAILVLLLVGPATNAASLVLVSKMLNGWATIRYLLIIIVVALLCGLAIDWIYSTFGLAESFREMARTESQSLLHIASAGALSALILWWTGKRLYRRVIRM